MEKVSPGNCQPIPTDCHHPGYQSLSARSWWCDACMTDCFEDCARDYNCNELSSPLWENATAWCSSTWESSVEDLLEFWHWFKPVCMFMVGGLLSAVFIVIAYYMRGQSAEQDIAPGIDNDRKQQYWCLNVTRDKRLLSIARLKTEIGKAAFDGDIQHVRNAEAMLERCYVDLENAEYAIESMEYNYPDLELSGRPWTRQGTACNGVDSQPPSIASTFLPVSMMSSDQH